MATPGMTPTTGTGGPQPIEPQPMVQSAPSGAPASANIDTRSGAVAQQTLNPPQTQSSPPQPLSTHQATQTQLPDSIKKGMELDARELEEVKQRVVGSRINRGNKVAIAAAVGVTCIIFGPVGWLVGGCLLGAGIAMQGTDFWKSLGAEIKGAENKENELYYSPRHATCFRLSQLLGDEENEKKFIEHMQREFGSTPLDLSWEPDRLKVEKAMNDFELTTLDPKHDPNWIRLINEYNERIAATQAAMAANPPARPVP